MNRLAMKHTCLSFAIATLHTYIATIALCQNFHGGTSMAWTFIPTWTTSPLNFTYNMHFRLKNEGKSRISSRFCRYILKYNASLSKNIPLSKTHKAYAGIHAVPCPTYFLFWKCGNLNEILRDVDLLEFVLHLYEHLCFIYGKIIFQCSFRNGKSTTVLPYKNRIKPKSLVQMKISWK